MTIEIPASIRWTPWQVPERKFWRRHLPHLEAPGATYFISFSCRRPIVLSSDARDVVMAEILRCAGKTICLDAAVVMPYHAHAVFRLIAPSSLTQFMKVVKGRTAHKINQVEGREGPLWTPKSFDRVVRDEWELAEKIEYIRQNPVKSRLVRSREQYRWLYFREKDAE